jgi:hypothetical protein
VGALTVYGGFAELLVREAANFLPTEFRIAMRPLRWDLIQSARFWIGPDLCAEVLLELGELCRRTRVSSGFRRATKRTSDRRRRNDVENTGRQSRVSCSNSESVARKSEAAVML